MPIKINQVPYNKETGNGTVQPIEDAKLYYELTQANFAVNDKYASCEFVGGNEVVISSGMYLIFGHMVVVSEETTTVPLATSQQDYIKARILIEIDLRNKENPTSVQVQTVRQNEELPALKQENILETGSVFQIPLARYEASSVAIVSSTSEKLVGKHLGEKANEAANKAQETANSALLPIGTILEYAGKVPPETFTWCDGRAMSRTDSKELFDVIGTTYGAGDGSTTFNVPQKAGRVSIGASSTYPLGATGGSTSHTLTTSQIPSHSHKGIAANSFTMLSKTNIQGYGSGTTSGFGLSPSIATANAGGGASHPNMMPWMGAHYIIKYKY